MNTIVRSFTTTTTTTGATISTTEIGITEQRLPVVEVVRV